MTPHRQSVFNAPVTMQQTVVGIPIEPQAIVAGFAGAHVGALLLMLLLGAHTVFHVTAFLLHYYDTVARRHEKPFSFFSYLRVFAGEWLFGIGVGLAYFVGFLPPRRTAPAVARGGPPILLVHGYMMNRSCMFVLYWGLRRFGFRNVSTMNYWPNAGPIEAAADQVAARVRELSRQHDGERVVVVAHSMGGLALRAALLDAPDLPIAKVIAIATPHSGTQMAYLAIGPAAEQLRPGSLFLEKIAAPPNVPLTSIYSRLDQIVFPATSAAFGDRIIEIEGVGHLTILLNPRTSETLAGDIQMLNAASQSSAETG